MWEQHQDREGFVRTKLSDLVALLSTFLALVVTIALTALSSGAVMREVLGWFGLEHAPGASVALQVVSLLASLLISWLLFTWMIARLPRYPLSFRSSMLAGLLAAVGFEVFQQVASVVPRGDHARPGRRDVRLGAGPTGVRVHHRPADPVRDRVGRDVVGKPCRGAGGAAGRPRSSRRGTWVPRASACGGRFWRVRRVRSVRSGCPGSRESTS